MHSQGLYSCVCKDPVNPELSQWQSGRPHLVLPASLVHNGITFTWPCHVSSGRWMSPNQGRLGNCPHLDFKKQGVKKKAAFISFLNCTLLACANVDGEKKWRTSGSICYCILMNHYLLKLCLANLSIVTGHLTNYTGEVQLPVKISCYWFPLTGI